MSTEVAKFDPTAYVDKVRDKIKQSLIDVIPDEQWNAMLKAEISAFFESRKERSTYSHDVREYPSEFRRIVNTVVEEETKKRIRDMLSTPEWSSYWDGTKQQAGEEIARIARENGAAILAKWLEAAIGQVILQHPLQQPVTRQDSIHSAIEKSMASEDIYREGASIAFDIPVDRVTREQRLLFKERFFVCAYNRSTNKENVGALVKAVAMMMRAQLRGP